MKEKKGIKISIILTLIGVVSLVTGITFAIYENTINAGKSQVIKTGIVNFTLTESTNGLVLDNLQELTDYEGMAQETFYEFTIKNTGNTITDYEISLVDKPNSSYTGTILNEKYIKVGLLKNNSKEIIVNLKDVNRLIDKVTLDVEDTVNYKLRLWLDFGDLEDEAKEALVGQKIFLALKINGIQNVNKVPTGADTLIKLTDNKDNSGLYTITHAKDSTLQIGTTEDITEYRYRGKDPKNYVKFNNETWRIIGVFPTDDGTGNIENRIKLVRNDSIGEYKFDDGTTAYNYSKQDNLMLLQDNNKLKAKYLEESKKYDVMLTAPDSGCTSCSNEWEKPTSLNRYLNGAYYNSLLSEDKNMVESVKYYLGGYSSFTSITTQDIYNYERKKIVSVPSYGEKIIATWLGKLSLMYASDYGYASSNCENKKLQDVNSTTNDLRICNDTNWLYNIKKDEWLLPRIFGADSSSGTFTLSTKGYISADVINNPNFVRPTLYLNSYIQITGGNGTSTNPYTLGL